MAKLTSLRSLSWHCRVPLLFSRKRTFRNTRKVGPMSRPCGQCGSEETSVPQNLLHGRRVPSCAWSASLLKQRHCKRKRSDTRQDRTPSPEPCRFRAASHQCRSIRCFGLREHLQELGRLIRPPPAHLSRGPARDLHQTTKGKCVPSSGEQPLLETHLATLHLFWPCHPFPWRQTRGVSIADCAPPKRDNSSATTSRRRASLLLSQVASRSQTVTFVETRPPPSRHTCAAAHSNESTKAPPTSAHVAR